MNFYGELGYLTSNSWLDFGDDPDNSVDTGIFKRNSYQFFSIHSVLSSRLHLLQLHLNPAAPISDSRSLLQ